MPVDTSGAEFIYIHQPYIGKRRPKKRAYKGSKAAKKASRR